MASFVSTILIGAVVSIGSLGFIFYVNKFMEKVFYNKEDSTGSKVAQAVILVLFLVVFVFALHTLGAQFMLLMNTVF